MKKKKPIIITVYVILGLLFLAGGIMYSRYQREGMAGVWNLTHLLSQSVPEPTDDSAKPEKPKMTREQITKRMSELESEILQETNDPDRDLKLRTELFSMKTQLELLNKTSQ